MPARRDQVERFHEKYHPEPNSGCWLWTAGLGKDGYGSFKADRESLAHRYSYILHKGPIPTGLEIDHKCRQRCCVNPSHLEAVTHAVNVQRTHQSGHHRYANRMKTHCIRGHEFTPENTLIEHYGGRYQRKCRTCRHEAQRARTNRLYPPRSNSTGRKAA